MPRVLDIQRRHMELGRIRMGGKGSKGQPTRLETWRLTSASRDLLESAAAVYGGTVEEWADAPDKGYYQLTTETASLDVMVPPGDAYSQYYELWSGGGCKRRCDGETELLTGLACKCDPDARECKITTRINVMLPQVAGLGVWRLESHGYYAAAELPDMLELLQQVSGGRIIGGVLRIEQRSSKKDGKTNRYPVPVLDLPNITLASLTGGGVIVNPPRLEPGKPPLLTGTEMTGETFDNGAPPIGPAPTLPDNHDYRRGELVDLMKEKGISLDGLEQYATLVGVPKTGRASNEQMDALIEAVRGHGTDAPLTLPLGGSGEPTDGLPVVPEDMTPDEAIAAGAALVGKS